MNAFNWAFNGYMFDIVGWTLMLAVMLICAFFWWAVGSLVAGVIKRIWHTVRG